MPETAPSPRRTELVVVSDDPAVADQVASTLQAQCGSQDLERTSGVLGVAGATRREVPVVVADIGFEGGSETWRMAALPGLHPSIAVVVVSRHPRRRTVAGTLHAQFVLDEAFDLPPLRELATGPARRATAGKGTGTPSGEPSGSHRRDGSSRR